MATHPEVQRKAQAELDAVVGPHRLPDMADRDALPYLNAILKETMRWHTAVPLGLFHMSTADDEYNGYFIPNGTIDRKSTRLNSSHSGESRMPSSA